MVLKRWRKIVLIVAACFFALILALSIVLNSESIQTQIVQQVKVQLPPLDEHLQVGSVRYAFPARLLLKQVYIDDEQGDSLLYVERIYAQLSLSSLMRSRLCVRKIELEQLRLNVYPLSDSTFNYTYLVEAFASKDSTDTTDSVRLKDIQFPHVCLTDVHVRYDSLIVDVPTLKLSVPHISQPCTEGAITECEAVVSRMGRRETLRVQSVEMALLLNDTTIALSTCRMELPHSVVDISGSMIGTPRQFERIQPSLEVHELQVAPQDLALFVPELARVPDYIDLHAHIGGRIDSLSAREVSLLLNGESIFRGQASVVGFPSWAKMYIDASCTDLFFPTRAVERMVAQMRQQPFVFPDEVHRMGAIHYRGAARGNLSHLVLRGALTTQVGTVTLNGECAMDSALARGSVSGTISTPRVALGQLLAKEEIGDIALSLSSSVQWAPEHKIGGEVDMHIDEFVYKDYPYHDFELRGMFDRLSGELEAAIHDPHIDWSLAGTFDLNHLSEVSDTLNTLHLESRLGYIHLGQLHLSDQYTDSEFSTVVKVDEEFLDWDHMDGIFRMDSTYMRRGEQEAWIGQQQIITSYTNSIHHIQLVGDLMSGELSGRFLPSEMGTIVLQQISRYLPSFFTQEQYDRLTSFAVTLAEDTANTYWDCMLAAHNWQEVQDVLAFPVRLSDDWLLNSHLQEQEDTWILDIGIPRVSVSNRAVLHQLSVHADNGDGRGHVNLSWEIDSMLCDLGIVAWNDSIDVHVNVDALPPYDSHSQLRILTHLGYYASRPLVQTHIFPGYVQLGDSVYHIDDSHITFNAYDTTLHVERLRVHGRSQFIQVDGVASRLASDSLCIGLSDINVGLIMPYLLPERTLTVNGWASGWVNLYSVLSKPIFEAQVQLDSTFFNESYFGTAKANVALNKVTGDIDIAGEVERFGRQAAVVKGLVESKKNRFRLDIRPDSLPLNFVEHWTHGFLENITGNVSGTVSVRGEGKKTYVITRAQPHHVGLTIPFTGCTYFVDDSIFMDSTSISFPHLSMTDEEGNPLQFNGRLTHDAYFQNFHLDLHAVLPVTPTSTTETTASSALTPTATATAPNGTLVIDLSPQRGQMFNGKVYATGAVDITGADNDIVLNATAVTTGKSAFRLALGGASSARDNSFVTFVNHRRADTVRLSPLAARLGQGDTTLLPHRKIKSKLVRGSNRFRMGMSIDIDPQTLFQLVLDDRTGDMIEARGDGAIKLVMDDATDELTLVGTYELVRGKMGFTIGNLIRRDFTIDAGSQIVWNGKAEKPMLNVTARYQVVASLKDLFGSETQNIVSGRTSVPVNTLIHLTGSLDDPIIRFSIELPKTEENVETQVRAVINTDEMMMRQVVYLLVFGKFFTPEYMKTSTANNTALNDTYALLSSTITGQINNWLGKLTNVFTLGFNVRQEGTEQTAAREYEAVFQIMPVDRLIINGNFGYRYNDVSNRPFFGDVDIECLLTPNGKYRLRGYSHTVDKYSLKQASTIQGIGFLFRHDFNWVNPEKKAARIAKRHGTPTLSPDSTALPADSINSMNNKE